jgi:hypothetical protein
MTPKPRGADAVAGTRSSVLMSDTRRCASAPGGDRRELQEYLRYCPASTQVDFLDSRGERDGMLSRKVRNGA